MDISSRRRPGGGLYSDRMVVEPGNRLGNVVSNAAREAAHSTTITSSRQYHQGSGASSKGRLASRLGPATHFSVTF